MGTSASHESAADASSQPEVDEEQRQDKEVDLAEAENGDEGHGRKDAEKEENEEEGEEEEKEERSKEEKEDGDGVAEERQTSLAEDPLAAQQESEEGRGGETPLMTSAGKEEQDREDDEEQVAREEDKEHEDIEARDPVMQQTSGKEEEGETFLGRAAKEERRPDDEELEVEGQDLEVEEQDLEVEEQDLEVEEQDLEEEEVKEEVQEEEVEEDAQEEEVKEDTQEEEVKDKVQEQHLEDAAKESESGIAEAQQAKEKVKGPHGIHEYQIHGEDSEVEDREDEEDTSRKQEAQGEVEQKHLGHNVLLIRLLLIVGASLWTMAVAHVSRQMETQVANAKWERDFDRLVAEERREIKDWQTKKRRKHGKPEMTAGVHDNQRAWKCQAAWIAPATVILAGLGAREAWCWHAKQGRREKMKQAVEDALTLYYRPQLHDVLGRHCLTHVFTGVRAAQQAGWTMQSPLLSFHGIAHLGWMFTLSLHVTAQGAINLFVNPAHGGEGQGVDSSSIGTESSAVASTSTSKLPAKQAASLVSSCILRILSQGSDNYIKCEKSFDLASGGFLDLSSQNELAFEEWTKGDMVVAQIELVLGRWSS